MHAIKMKYTQICFIISCYNNNVLYFQVIPSDYKEVAMYMVKNHLKKLLNDGKIIKLLDNTWEIKKK